MTHRQRLIGNGRLRLWPTANLVCRDGSRGECDDAHYDFTLAVLPFIDCDAKWAFTDRHRLNDSRAASMIETCRRGRSSISRRECSPDGTRGFALNLAWRRERATLLVPRDQHITLTDDCDTERPLTYRTLFDMRDTACDDELQPQAR
jgi:hypothetical protein